MKDFQYYEGSDIKEPFGPRPKKPIMPKNATPDIIREYADDLEDYERRLTSYNRARKEYYEIRKARYDEFLVDLKREMNLPEKAADCIIEFVKENISYNDLEDFHEKCHDQLYLFKQINACLA